MMHFARCLVVGFAGVASSLSARPQSSDGPATVAPAAASAAVPPASFIPASFSPKTLIEGPGFKLVPLGPAVVRIDFAAYMSSIEHLQTTFTRSTEWPLAGISDGDAMRDMESEAGRFARRESFAYAVLTPDGRRERGSVYVSPSPSGRYDAVVRMWVTKAEYDAGFDAALYAWVTRWVKRDWPFTRVAYPGRAIDWATWDALVKGDGAAAKE